MDKGKNKLKFEKHFIQINFPLKWDLKLKFNVLPERPTPCVVENGEWRRAINFNERLIPLIVKFDKKERIVVFTNKVTKNEWKNIRRLIIESHGLKNVKKLYEFMEKDRVLKKIKNELYGFGRAGLMSANVYEGVIKAIVQQQISLRVAENIIANIVERYGRRIEFCGTYVYNFPSPETIANLKLEELRNCGLSFRKSEYIKEFSCEVEKGFNPDELKSKNEEEIMEILTSFRGIGRWTVELVMVASMGKNVIPADDLGVKKAISHFYFKDELQSPEKVKKFAENRFGNFLRDILIYLLMAYRMGL
ncbi:MAG TPA: DNA-3-methyladenine glycosylase 2 family protein [Thermoplasmatales archaeon]|nr:DNA-3-methyladenine glycosylase 2 family protein [Thermoplasmatales archaeon]